MASALAAILTVTALTTVWTERALADQIAGNGGIGGAGGAGGVGGSGGLNSVYKAGGNNYQSADGGSANGGNGGSANGGNICNHVKAIRAGVGGELCGSS